MSNLILARYFKNTTATNIRNSLVNITKEGEVCEWECTKKSKTGEIIPITGFNGFRLKFRTTNKSNQLVVSNPELYIRSGGMYGLGFRNLHCIGNCVTKNNVSSKIEFDINIGGELEYTPKKTITSCKIGPCGNNGGCIMKNDNIKGGATKLCCFDGSGGTGCNTSENLCGIDGTATLCGRNIDKCGPSPGPKKKNIVAYFINWGGQLSDEQMSGLQHATHVIVAFAVNYKWVDKKMTPFTSCKNPLNFDIPNKSTAGVGTHADFIKKVKNINHNIKILMSIGGGLMKDGWTTCLDTDKDISESAAQMIQLFRNPDGNNGIGYDGIDIDMENTDDNKVIINTGKLVTELIKQRGDANWLITIVPMSNQIIDTSYVENIIRPNPKIDLINVQYYNTGDDTWTPGCDSHGVRGAKVCVNFKNAMKLAGISAEKIVPMIATNGNGDGCKWRCENGDDCSNNVTNININQVACAYHKIDPNFGGLGYWAFNLDNSLAPTYEPPAAPYLLVEDMYNALNNLEECSTCLAPLEC